MTLYCQWFVFSGELTKFVNTNAIDRANILKIDADSANGGWVLWWWA